MSQKIWQNHWRLRRLGCVIQAALKEYRRRQALMAGEDMEIILSGNPPLPLEAWMRVRGLYIVAVDHTLMPAQITLDWIMAECVKLYRSIPPPPDLGENIPTSVTPSQIDDSVPTVEEVEWAVRRL